MRKLISLLFCILFCTLPTPASAQTASQMFLAMPDSLMPYLNAAQRTELIALKALDPTEPSVVSNVLGAESTLEALSDARLCCRPSKGTQMELLRLPSEEGDSLFCLLKTVSMPESETTAYIYNKEWVQTGRHDFQGIELTQKPDTMAEGRYRELLSMIEFPVVQAQYAEPSSAVSGGTSGVSEGPAEITLSLNIPFLTQADREALAPIIITRKLRWDGKNFK